ncbi:MAG: hypothetical protein IIW85_03005, partial [Bacteroidaceae bacterium]|nr:hypothetical protein [Bacteroidaceae bacterium]
IYQADLCLHLPCGGSQCEGKCDDALFRHEKMCFKVFVSDFRSEYSDISRDAKMSRGVLGLVGTRRKIASFECKRCVAFSVSFEIKYQVFAFVLSFCGSEAHFVTCDIFCIFEHNRECCGYSLFFCLLSGRNALQVGCFCSGCRIS